jgi:actin-like ATPase involved in cell morphogenesis
VADEALLCVVLGTGKVLENLDLYEKVLMKSFRD